MRIRLWVVILALIGAALACTLGGSDDKKESSLPTPIPTSIVLVPTPTLQPTSSPLPTTTAPPANVPCTPRTDWPVMTVAAGDTLYGIALRTNSTIQALAAANCLGNADAITAGQALRVPNVPPPVITATPNQTCTAQWFFTFDAGKFDTRAPCPNPVVQVTAAGQDFEGGRMLWYASLPGNPADQRGTIFVIYNDGSWITYPDTWATGQPESDPSIVPPTGRYQPIRGFGKVWRDNADVRQQLGWAYELEQAFTGRFQEPTGYAGIWNGRDAYFYVDHGKWGLVLRLYAVNMGPNYWEVAGRYQ